MDKGLIHLYCGDGPGKTTAAMGLCLRALGQGLQVTVVQFLKPGTSGELEPLRRLGAQIFSGYAGMKFVSQMSETEKAETRRYHTEILNAALQTSCDVLLLDEAAAAWNHALVDETLLRHAVLSREREVILTGRSPAEWMVQAADYITEMLCVRHPYASGLPARKGVEF